MCVCGDTLPEVLVCLGCVSGVMVECHLNASREANSRKISGTRKRRGFLNCNIVKEPTSGRLLRWQQLLIPSTDQEKLIMLLREGLAEVSLGLLRDCASVAVSVFVVKR